MTRLRVYVLSNDDLTSRLIFAPLFADPAIEVVGLACTSTLLGRSARGGRLRQALTLLKRTSLRFWAFQVLLNAPLALRDAIGQGGRSWPKSLTAPAAERGLEARSSADFSSPEFVEIVRAAQPDIVVVRVNQILRRPLLEVAPHGVWCVHSSLLPAFGGIAAEFHTMRLGQVRIGTTIFQVSEELDAGELLVQSEVQLDDGSSLFRAIVTNNLAAGELLAGSLAKLSRGTFARDVDPPADSSYHSWPSSRDVREFRGRGHKLIRASEAASYLAAVSGLRRGAPVA